MSDNASKEAQLAEAWSGTVTPYSQIKDSMFVTPDDLGQYDFLIKALVPKIGDNGLYCVEGEFTIEEPKGFSAYRRTLWIGSKKDPMAKLPETRLNSPGLRFLKNIAKVNNLPTNDQSDAALCAAITGRGFGCRIEKGNEYTAKDGTKKFGTDFGRNVTPKGMIPAKLDRATAATPMGTNGAAPDLAGASFGGE